MKKAVCILVTLLVIGCASYGNILITDESLVSQIIVSETTREQVIGLFGKPTSESIGNDGSSVMTYSYNKRLAYRLTTEGQRATLIIELKDGVVSKVTKSKNKLTL